MDGEPLILAALPPAGAQSAVVSDRSDLKRESRTEHLEQSRIHGLD
jgi:hypothetical protein